MRVDGQIHGVSFGKQNAGVATGKPGLRNTASGGEICGKKHAARVRDIEEREPLFPRRLRIERRDWAKSLRESGRAPGGSPLLGGEDLGEGGRITN